MEDPTRSPKRRRVERSFSPSSSADELAEISDYDRPRPKHRASFTGQHDQLPSRSRRSYNASASELSTGSSDELGDDVRPFWRRSRSRSPVHEGRSRNRDRRSDDGSEGHRHEERDEAMMDKSSVTPIERPGTPPLASRLKPTRLHYKQKMVLRGHKRGVAAVKFSPDGLWIASCCKSYEG